MSTAAIVLHRATDREKAHRWIDKAPWGTSLLFRLNKRSADQNALLWAKLGEVAQQVVWHGQKLTADDWKDVFMATLNKARIVPGIDGGFVPIGMRSSSLSKQEFSDLLELINAFAAEHNVVFSSPREMENERRNASRASETAA